MWQQSSVYAGCGYTSGMATQRFRKAGEFAMTKVIRTDASDPWLTEEEKARSQTSRGGPPQLPIETIGQVEEKSPRKHGKRDKGGSPDDAGSGTLKTKGE